MKKRLALFYDPQQEPFQRSYLAIGHVSKGYVQATEWVDVDFPDLPASHSDDAELADLESRIARLQREREERRKRRAGIKETP